MGSDEGRCGKRHIARDDGIVGKYLLGARRCEHYKRAALASDELRSAAAETADTRSCSMHREQHARVIEKRRGSCRRDVRKRSTRPYGENWKVEDPSEGGTASRFFDNSGEVKSKLLLNDSTLN